MKKQTLLSPDEAALVRAEWLAEEQAIRARMAPMGRISQQELGACSGLEFLSRIIRGELPAILSRVPSRLCQWVTTPQDLQRWKASIRSPQT